MFYKKITTGAQARSASDINLNLIDSLPRFSKYEVMELREKQQYVDNILKAAVIGANDLIVDVAYNIDYEIGYNPLEHVIFFYDDEEPYFFNISGYHISEVLTSVMRVCIKEGLI